MDTVSVKCKMSKSIDLDILEKLTGSTASLKPNQQARLSIAQLDQIALIEAAILLLFFNNKNIGESAESQEACALALVKLLECRRQLCFKSAVELAERSIELNISPEDFLAVFQESWVEEG
jgi:hypothetical protein